MKIKFVSLISLVFSTVITLNAQSDNWTPARPDGHAPVGIMGDHYHKKGGMMFSYRYMPMWMNGNLSSSDEIDDQVIYNNYMIAPQKMLMSMHMAGFMYAPADNLTLMLMANYVTNTMDLDPNSGMNFTTESAGFGDLALSGIIKIVNKNRQSLHANVGLSIPTGDIDRHDNRAMMDTIIVIKLAYPMQLGSGTFDPVLGFTYLGQQEMISWGVQTKYKFRIGENSKDYTLGNQLDLTGWGAVKVSEHFSFSARVSYCNTSKISGADADMNPMMMPLFNTENSGRNQLDLGIESNFIPSGSLKNLRFGVEIKYPVMQKVNGIQMRNTLTGVCGIQYSIGHHE